MRLSLLSQLTSNQGWQATDSSLIIGPDPQLNYRGFHIYYLERRQESERQRKKAKGKKSKPRGSNYQWTLGDYVNGPSNENIEQAREQDEAWFKGSVSVQARPLGTIPKVQRNIPLASTYIEKKDRGQRKNETSGVSSSMQQRLCQRGPLETGSPVLKVRCREEIDRRIHSLDTLKTSLSDDSL